MGELRVEAERGSGLISTSFGLTVFFVMLFAAVQIMFHLYANTMVGAAAYDAARSLASYGVSANRCAAVPTAKRQFVDSLGDYATAANATLHVTCNHPDVVRVRVTATHPSILPSTIGGLSALGNFDRTIEIRAETHQ